MAFEPRQTLYAALRHGNPRLWLHGLEAWLEKEREQIALWVPVAFLVGIAAWFALPDRHAWIAWCCVAAALAASGLLLRDGTRIQRIVVAAGVLACAGCLAVWAKAMWIGEPPLARPLFTMMSARVLSADPMPAQAMTRLVVAPLARPDLPARVRVNVADKDMQSGIAPSAVIRFRVRLMPPAPPAVPGGYDFAARAYFLGIGATGRALPPVVLEKRPAMEGSALRQQLSRHIRARVEGGAGAIAATLATGDRGAISDADAEAMRRSGLAHLLSISGLHVTALVGAVIFLIFRLLALSRGLALRLPLMLIAAGGGAVAGIGYTLLTGAEVPTIRSCVAALLVLAGLALGREAITLRLVAAGAVFVLLFWPEAVIGPSFQMSFAAVTAIVALCEHPAFRRLTSARDEHFARRVFRPLLALFLTGIAVELVLTPIALYHFHKAGMLGALANLAAIPLTTFVIMPFEALALLLDLAGIGAPAWWVVEQALNLLLAIAHGVAASPMAQSSAPPFPPWIFGAIMTGVLWCLLWRTWARWLGVFPIALGIVAIVLNPSPDILVTGDGRHVAARLPGGAMAILRAGAGEYIRDTLSENAGFDGKLSSFAELPNARCSADLCALNIVRDDRTWRVLATRSADYLPWRDFARDCAVADIVISDRRLPRSCKPRWLRIDRVSLRRTGGMAIYLPERAVRTVQSPTDRHPWIVRPK